MRISPIIDTSDRPVRGVNMVLLSDGREIHLDDITTAAEGREILDGLDGSILKIEAQLAYASDVNTKRGDQWRARAETALRWKRRCRPRLQQRIGELRRSERAAQPLPDATTSPKDGRRKAFIDAAEALLPHETVTEIWARAQEMRPAAFGAEGPAS